MIDILALVIGFIIFSLIGKLINLPPRQRPPPRKPVQSDEAHARAMKYAKRNTFDEEHFQAIEKSIGL